MEPLEKALRQLTRALDAQEAAQAPPPFKPSPKCASIRRAERRQAEQQVQTAREVARSVLAPKGRPLRGAALLETLVDLLDGEVIRDGDGGQDGHAAQAAHGGHAEDGERRRATAPPPPVAP